jgi:hypothetical protein
MIKLTDILKEIEQDHIDEIGVKDIALGAMMAASTLGSSNHKAAGIPSKTTASSICSISALTGELA